MDFVAAMDAPVVRRVDGVEISFPIWTCAQVAAYASRLHARRIEAGKKLAAELKLDPMERVTLIGQLQIGAPTPWDVARAMDTIEGATECLTMSLESAGHSKEQAAVIVGRLTPIEQVELARLVARIVPPPPPGGADTPTPGSSTGAAGST
jgi:hypothetical protein